MSFFPDDIVETIMQNAVAEAIPKSGNSRVIHSGNALKKYHVSQTADQLPDFRARNAYYRTELDRQIQEKREADKKRREREMLEEERLLRRIEADREKLRREYYEEIEKRALVQDETKRRQQAITKRLEELQHAEEKKREEEAMNRKRQLYNQLYSESKSSSYYNYNHNKYSQNSHNNSKPWNSRDYVHSALRLSLEDVYEQASLHMLADVYKKLEFEKLRMREIIKRRITDGEKV